MYWTSVKPSVRSNSSATHSGLRQVLGICGILILVVSGGRSAASDLGRNPKMAPVPAIAAVLRNLLRLQGPDLWLLTMASLRDPPTSYFFASPFTPHAGCFSAMGSVIVNFE